MLVGGETGGRWLGGFDRSLQATLLFPLVSQQLEMLASKEGGEDLAVVRELNESGQVTAAIDRGYPLSTTRARSNTPRTVALEKSVITI